MSGFMTHIDAPPELVFDETFTSAPEDGGAIIRFIASPAIEEDAMTSLTDLKTMMEAKATTGGAA